MSRLGAAGAVIPLLTDGQPEVLRPSTFMINMLLTCSLLFVILKLAIGVPVSMDNSMKIVSLAEKIIEPPNCYQVEVTTMDGWRQNVRKTSKIMILKVSLLHDSLVGFYSRALTGVINDIIEYVLALHCVSVHGIFFSNLCLSPGGGKDCNKGYHS